MCYITHCNNGLKKHSFNIYSNGIEILKYLKDELKIGFQVMYLNNYRTLQ